MPAIFGAALAFLVSFAVVALLFAFIFKVLPDAEIEWRNVWTGAAGSVVILLLWIDYASCILLFGAEFTQVYARETGHEIRPSPHAVPLTAEAQAQHRFPSAIWERTGERR